MPRDTARNAILNAAVTVLGRDGLDGFTAAALAKEAGTSKANVFHHFATLDEIAIASFEVFGAAMLDAAPTGADAGWLRALGDSSIAMAEHQRTLLNAYFVFFTKSLFDARLRERVRATFDPLLERMASQFGPDVPDAPARARLLAIVLDGLALHLLIAGATGDIRAAWNLFVDLIEGRTQP
ncbi:MAG: TetR family transcriptional regulator [Proteobacteria bacterium]|nr:TetR family transcriptional regulator [Pseudomonadota bacterium]